jgi:CBS domain-containing protein
MTTTVRDVMTPDVEIATRAQSLRDAARMMRSGDYGAMPVVDEGQLVGMLTDRDIVVRAVAEGIDPNLALAGDFATREPVAVAPDTTLDDALELMGRHRVRRLPVVEEGLLVGVLSQADVALEAKEKRTGEVVQEISQPGVLSS